MEKPDYLPAGTGSFELGGQAEIAPGVTIPEEYEAWFGGRFGYDIGIEARISEQSRIEVDRIIIDRRGDGPAVTSEGIRSIQVQSLIRELIESEVEDAFYSDGKYGDRGFRMLTIEEAEALKKLGPSPVTLEWVARIYKVAELLDKPPTVAIEEAFDISRSTAGAWIGRARSADLLPPPRNANA